MSTKKKTNGEILNDNSYDNRNKHKQAEQAIDKKIDTSILSRKNIRDITVAVSEPYRYYAIASTAVSQMAKTSSQDQSGTIDNAYKTYSTVRNISTATGVVSDISNKAQLIVRPITKSSTILTMHDVRKISKTDNEIGKLATQIKYPHFQEIVNEKISKLEKVIKSGTLTGKDLRLAKIKLENLKGLKNINKGITGRNAVFSLFYSPFMDEARKSREVGSRGVLQGVQATETAVKFVLPTVNNVARGTIGLAKLVGTKATETKIAKTTINKSKKIIRNRIDKSPKLRKIERIVNNYKKNHIRKVRKKAINKHLKVVRRRKVISKIKNSKVLKPIRFVGNVLSSPFKAASFVKFHIQVVLGFIKKIIGYVVFALLFIILLIHLFSAIASSIGSIINGDVSDSGKIDLSKFAEVLEKKDEKYEKELQKIVDKYDYVTFLDGYSTDNLREIVSMSAVYFDQDFEDWDKVKSYLNKMYDLSHSYTVNELPDTYCSGCEERKYSCAQKGHEIDNSKKGGCKEKVIPDSETVRLNSEAKKGDTTIYNNETYTFDGIYWVNYYCNGVHKEKYCPGHSNAEVTLDTMHFDELFEVDPIGSAEATPGVNGDYIGEFTITYYCCEKTEYINGDKHMCNAGPPYLTASETTPTPGRTIAVDPDVIPLGSKVVINGYEYIAEDTGGKINGKRIDIVVATHAEALEKGIDYRIPVFYAEENGELTEDQKTDIESNSWDGWTEDNIEIVKNIYNQNWSEIYEGWESLVSTEYIEVDWDQIELVDGELTDKQKKIVEVATHSASYGIKAPAGWCQAWVADVYAEVTGKRYSKGSALKAGNAWAVSNDWSKIPVGATVYGHPTYSESGIKYGHVGIYIGNGIVAHNIGGVDYDSIEKWQVYYRGYAWGWNGNQDLSK